MSINIFVPGAITHHDFCSLKTFFNDPLFSHRCKISLLLKYYLQLRTFSLRYHLTAPVAFYFLPATIHVLSIIITLTRIPNSPNNTCPDNNHYTFQIPLRASSIVNFCLIHTQYPYSHVIILTTTNIYIRATESTLVLRSCFRSMVYS